MSCLPELRDELVAAAERSSAARRRSWVPRRRGAALAAVVLGLSAVGTASAVLVETGVLGGAPSRPVPRVVGEEAAGMERVREPRVLGLANVPGVGRVELVGYAMRGYGGKGTLQCLDVAFPDGTRSGGCDASLPGRLAGVLSPGPGADRSVAVGATREPVSRVTVNYTDERGESGEASAQLLSVDAGPDAAQFVYYLAPIPVGARALSATALDAGGKHVWTATPDE